jgi:hypothetical protein
VIEHDIASLATHRRDWATAWNREKKWAGAPAHRTVFFVVRRDIILAPMGADFAGQAAHTIREPLSARRHFHAHGADLG